MTLAPVATGRGKLLILGCALCACTAGIGVLRLDVPIYKTGLWGMALMTAWLIPLIVGFVLVGNTAAYPKSRLRKNLEAALLILVVAWYIARLFFGDQATIQVSDDWTDATLTWLTFILAFAPPSLLLLRLRRRMVE